MQQPTLVILAAGMGSRFGGLKQIKAVDNAGHAIIDFSLYDAYQAGFRKVVFVIKRAIESDFKNAVGKRMERYFDVRYAYQELDRLPQGYEIPEGRVKPWGTGHAVMCAAAEIDGPFAVINADDFYGPSAYSALYGYLVGEHPENQHAMVAYRLKNTVTENGAVARGICTVKDSFLEGVVERTRIEKRGDEIAFTLDGESWAGLDVDSPVSMNFWGFGRSMLDELQRRFPRWLDENLPVNPEKCEYFLPSVANALINEDIAKVQVLDCHETWHGITYKEDMDNVISAIAELRRGGVYPEKLLD